MIFNAIKNLRDEDPLVRNRAAVILGDQIAVGENVIHELKNALDDLNWRVRGSAAKALAKLKPWDSDIFFKLLGRLEDEEEAVKIEAVSAISHMLQQGFVLSDEEINTIALIYHREGETTQRFVIEILGESPVCSLVATEVISHALKHSNQEVRYLAARVTLNNRTLACQVLPAMIFVLLQGDDDEKSLVLAALGELGKDAISSKHAVEEVLKSQDSHMRFLAALTLSKVVEGYKSDMFVEVLHKSLESDNSDEALTAKRILTNLTDDRA